jgi:hypothetical protein
MTALCPFVDDTIDEAISLTKQLQNRGVPFDLSPMSPAGTTLATRRLIIAAKPNAVIIDYNLSGTPDTKSDDLAFQLIGRGVPTVIVTKDRDIADRTRIEKSGHIIPIFFKQRLIRDVEYVAELIRNLGGDNVIEKEIDSIERLNILQEKSLLHSLSNDEKKELQILLARLELEETIESAQIDQAQSNTQKDVDSLINMISHLMTEFKTQPKKRYAVSKKSRHSSFR